MPGDGEPVCGCTHHRAMHDPRTGRCAGKSRRGDWVVGWSYDRCTCQQYIGPEPIDAGIWVPPIEREQS
jgi:hypothetical protein